MLQSMRSAAKYIWILLVIFFIGGFLLVQTSGLLGRAPVTAGTAVGEVNGQDILYTEWQNASQQLAQNEEARLGRGLTLDERQRVEDQAFDQLVNEILLRQELGRRGIRVTDEEIRQAARFSPPPQFAQAPELQTEGQFDLAKYQRFLASPAAKQQGILYQLEQYYRQEIPRQKLFERIANEVYVTDAELWRGWRDARDSARVTFVKFSAALVPDSAVTVPESDIRAYYEKHRDAMKRPGRASVSLVSIPRVVSAADSAASLARAQRLRQEITSGTSSFADVAKRESSDSVSAAQGGSLGRNTLDGFGFVPEFTAGVRGLATGQISQPVLSPFGYHLIRVDARTGDTLALSHILVPVQQSDSSASRVDRRADSLANAVANSVQPARFDSVVKAMGLNVSQAAVTEGNPLLVGSRYVPDVAAWAFSGAQRGEVSDLISADDGYYVARLDSLTPGGVPPLADVHDAIRSQLATARKEEQLMPRAAALSTAAMGSSLEQAASASGQQLQQTPFFTRVSGTPGLGTFSRATGAAFALPVGAVSSPVSTGDGLAVLRVDRRINTDSSAWVAQKPLQRRQVELAFQRQSVQQFLTNLREAANIEDRRAEVRAAGRQAAES